MEKPKWDTILFIIWYTTLVSQECSNTGDGDTVTLQWKITSDTQGRGTISPRAGLVDNEVIKTKTFAMPHSHLQQFAQDQVANGALIHGVVDALNRK